MAAVLYAGRPKEGYFKVSDPGTISISDSGAMSFAASDKGKHHRLTIDPDQKDKVAQAYIELTSAKPVQPQRFRPPAANANANGKPPAVGGKPPADAAKPPADPAKKADDVNAPDEPPQPF
jgi:hypothetical protein